MPHVHDIPTGTTVTLSPNQRRVAGFWDEDMDNFTTVWTDRIADAVDRGEADIVSIGEIDRANNITLDDHQKIEWSDNARIEYDSTADEIVQIAAKAEAGHSHSITDDTDHTASDHENGGSLEVTHNNLAITADDHHTRPVPGTLLSEDGSNNFNVDIARDTGSASGDGSTVTFTFSHSLGATPTVAHVTPTSAAAAGDHYVSAKSSTSIEVTFASAPASGTDNVTFDIITA